MFDSDAKKLLTEDVAQARQRSPKVTRGRRLSGKGVLKLQRQVNNTWSDACSLLASLCTMHTQVVDIVRTIRPALPELRPLMEESLACAGAAVAAAVPGSLCFETWPRVPEDAIWQELGSSDFEAETTSWREVCEALQPQAELARALLAHAQACEALGFYGGLAPPHSKASLRRTRELARRVAAMRAAAAAARPTPRGAERRARRQVDEAMQPRSSPVLTVRRVSLRLGALSLHHDATIEITPARLPLGARAPQPVLVSGPTALLHRLAACDVRWYNTEADGAPALLSARQHGSGAALVVPQLTALVSWGGISGPLVAPRTWDESLSRSGPRWCGHVARPKSG